MHILVTGAGGFVGRHLIHELAENGYSITAFDAPGVQIGPATEIIHGDIRDVAAIDRAFKETKPDACVHLAGISFVPDGASDPDLIFSVNIRGTINVLDAVRKHAPACRTLIVSTAHIYEGITSTDALDEKTIPAPLSNYAISKTAADLTTLAFANRFDIHAMTVRPHNHSGPGQSTKFVIPSFIQQAKDIAAGRQKPVIETGNMDCERDFSDVRDVVRAYRLLIEKGKPGNAYNIASCRQYKIGEILNKICEIANIKPETRTDPARFRPTDRSPVLDTSKIRRDTGWQPEIELAQTLSDIVDSHDL